MFVSASIMATPTASPGRLSPALSHRGYLSLIMPGIVRIKESHLSLLMPEAAPSHGEARGPGMMLTNVA